MAGLYGPDLSSLFEQTTSCVFVAGGIGITGLTEAIQVCAQRGVPFAVLWIVHTAVEMASAKPRAAMEGTHPEGSSTNQRFAPEKADADPCHATVPLPQVAGEI